MPSVDSLSHRRDSRTDVMNLVTIAESASAPTASFPHVPSGRDDPSRGHRKQSSSSSSFPNVFGSDKSDSDPRKAGAVSGGRRASSPPGLTSSSEDISSSDESHGFPFLPSGPWLPSAYSSDEGGSPPSQPIAVRKGTAAGGNVAGRHQRSRSGTLVIPSTVAGMMLPPSSSQAAAEQEQLTYTQSHDGTHRRVRSFTTFIGPTSEQQHQQQMHTSLSDNKLRLEEAEEKMEVRHRRSNSLTIEPRLPPTSPTSPDSDRRISGNNKVESAGAAPRHQRTNSFPVQKEDGDVRHRRTNSLTIEPQELPRTSPTNSELGHRHRSNSLTIEPHELPPTSPTSPDWGRHRRSNSLTIEPHELPPTSPASSNLDRSLNSSNRHRRSNSFPDKPEGAEEGAVPDDIRHRRSNSLTIEPQLLPPSGVVATKSSGSAERLVSSRIERGGRLHRRSNSFPIPEEEGEDEGLQDDVRHRRANSLTMDATMLRQTSKKSEGGGEETGVKSLKNTPLPPTNNPESERFVSSSSNRGEARPPVLHHRSKSLGTASLRTQSPVPTPTSSSSATNLDRLNNNKEGAAPSHVRRNSSSSSIASSVTHGGSADSSSSTIGGTSSDEELENLLASLRTRTQMLGNAHPKVGLSWNLVGNAFFRQADYVSAAEAYGNALQCYRASYGLRDDDDDDHTDEEDDDRMVIERRTNIAMTLANLATAYWRTGRLDESVSCLERSLHIRVKVAKASGRDIKTSVEVAGGLYQLGLTRCLRGEYKQAMTALKKAHEIQLSVLGPNHVEVARTVDAMGKIYLMDGQADVAMEHHREALRIKRSVLGSRHPTVVASMLNVAAAHKVRGELDEALEMYRDVLAAQRSIVAREMCEASKSPKAVNAVLDVAATLQSVGEVHKLKRDRAEAVKSYTEALLMYREAGLKDDDSKVKALLSELKPSPTRGHRAY